MIDDGIVPQGKKQASSAVLSPFPRFIQASLRHHYSLHVLRRTATGSSFPASDIMQFL
jgi:hypothetical protein